METWAQENNNSNNNDNNKGYSISSDSEWEEKQQFKSICYFRTESPFDAGDLWGNVWAEAASLVNMKIFPKSHHTHSYNFL